MWKKHAINYYFILYRDMICHHRDYDGIVEDTQKISWCVEYGVGGWMLDAGINGTPAHPASIKQSKQIGEQTA